MATQMDVMYYQWDAYIGRINKQWSALSYNNIQSDRAYFEAEREKEWKCELKQKEINRSLYPSNDFAALPERVELWRADSKSPCHYYDADPKILKTIYRTNKDSNEAREQVWCIWRGIHP